MAGRWTVRNERGGGLVEGGGSSDVAPALGETPEIALYRAVAAKHPGDAHSRYNALVRRLVSFERALERMVARGDSRPFRRS